MEMQISLPSPRVAGSLTDSQREELERSGVEFYKDGRPVWYTVPEWFDELDRKLIEHFGDEYRELANTRRTRWNHTGRWRFRNLIR